MKVADTTMQKMKFELNIPPVIIYFVIIMNSVPLPYFSHTQNQCLFIFKPQLVHMAYKSNE